jgi:hypothetical protein
MDADFAGELLADLENTENVHIDNLVMDDDSTTIARLTRDLGRDINKHTTNGVRSALYKLQHKEMTKDVIKYFFKSVTYATLQNKGNDAGLIEALQSIVPHAFGSHDMCGAWCGYSDDPSTYRYKMLPGGRDLQSES